MAKNNSRFGFYHVAEAWYAESSLPDKNCVDEVMFGDYPEGGGTKGELAVRWYELDERGKSTAKLECFADAFHILSQWKEIISELGERGNVTPQEFIAMLKEHGFVDLTPRERK